MMADKVADNGTPSIPSSHSRDSSLQSLGSATRSSLMGSLFDAVSTSRRPSFDGSFVSSISMGRRNTIINAFSSLNAAVTDINKYIGGAESTSGSDYEGDYASIASEIECLDHVEDQLREELESIPHFRTDAELEQMNQFLDDDELEDLNTETPGAWIGSYSTDNIPFSDRIGLSIPISPVSPRKLDDRLKGQDPFKPGSPSPSGGPQSSPGEKDTVTDRSLTPLDHRQEQVQSIWTAYRQKIKDSFPAHVFSLKGHKPMSHKLLTRIEYAALKIGSWCIRIH